MRPTGLGSGIDKDRADYTVYCGEWDVGRIYEMCGGPDSLRWFWSMTVNGPTPGAEAEFYARLRGRPVAFTRPGQPVAPTASKPLKE